MEFSQDTFFRDCEKDIFIHHVYEREREAPEGNSNSNCARREMRSLGQLGN
jgi:hypothetical protein